MTDRDIFKERFERLYEGKRLLAVQLDGFTHRVIYDDFKGNEKPIRDKIQTEVFSGCMGNEEARSYGMNSDRVIEFFEGYPNYKYQNNAQEIVYVMP